MSKKSSGRGNEEVRRGRRGYPREFKEEAVQMLLDVVRRGSIQVKGDVWVLLAKFSHHTDERLHVFRLATANRNFPRQQIVGMGEFAFSFRGQRHNFLGAAPQQEAIFGQGDAVLPALKELDPQLNFQLR